jgi:hypothetical protein
MILKTLATAALALLCTTAVAAAGTLTIHNNSKENIVELKVAPASNDDWTSLDDVLKGAKIASGASGTVTGIDPGKWDLQITDSDNQSCEMLAVTLSGEMDLTIDDGDLGDCEK